MRSLIIILCLLVIFSCKRSKENKTTQNEKQCIEKVLVMDDSLGIIRNHACETIALSKSIEQYVNSLQQIDFTDCPDQFSKSFIRHEAAWLDMLEISDMYPNLRGEMHDLFDSLKTGNDAERFNELLQNIWDTWGEVEKSSKM